MATATKYSRALARLTHAVQLAAQQPLSELEQRGLIQAFEFAHELARNVMKDYFFRQDTNGLSGSDDATRAALSKEIIDDDEGWMATLKSRNLTSHTDNIEIAEQIARQIIGSYHPRFIAVEERMRGILANK